MFWCAVFCSDVLYDAVYTVVVLPWCCRYAKLLCDAVNGTHMEKVSKGNCGVVLCRFVGVGLCSAAMVLSWRYAML